MYKLLAFGIFAAFGAGFFFTSIIWYLQKQECNDYPVLWTPIIILLLLTLKALVVSIITLLSLPLREEVKNKDISTIK